MLETNSFPAYYTNSSKNYKSNKNRGNATQIIFKLLLQEDDAEVEYFMIYTKVRLVSKGTVLERFLKLLLQVKKFFTSRNENCFEWEKRLWYQLVYLQSQTSH